MHSAKEGFRSCQKMDSLAAMLRERAKQNWNRMESTYGKEADSARTGPRHGCLPIPFTHPKVPSHPVRLLPVRG